MCLRSPENPAEWAAYYFCRWCWLRAPWGLRPGSERDPADASALHLALFSAQESLPKIAAVGCVVLANDLETAARLRFVATDPSLRSLGYGRRLMTGLEELVTKSSRTRIILHAREEAVPFYLKLGYRVEHPLPPAVANIPHFLMEKAL
ncbi:MAG: GNAT family N-acetyltransferase [Opitutales bacterium]|nr:GNAT family N-acetyltransferase [Opitutales bacterium]